jgi:4-amino-4-deoxy-L-arabinose transferase-like glycosyltransferase
MDKNQRRALIVLLSAAAAALFINFGARALWDPDEARYAEMAREVVVLNDWITPHLNFLVYFEKPMMYIWLVAASFKVFGANEWAARLVSVLCALGGAALTGLMASRLWGKKSGLVASIVLLTSLEYLILAVIVDVNMTLTLFITAAMVFFWLGQQEKKRTWFYLFWASMALATLTKGPIGMVLPGGAIVIYILISRQFALARESRPVSGILLFLLVAAPWYISVSLINPDFLHFFFIEQNYERFAISQEHNKPFHYLFMIIILGLLPWTFLLPLEIKKIWERGFAREIQYILCWFLVILLFFTFSRSKLATYVLPCLPPLALLTADVLREKKEGGRILLYAAGILWVCLGMILGFFPVLVSNGILKLSSSNALPLMDIGPWAGIVMTAAALVGIFLGRKYGSTAGFAILGIALTLTVNLFSPYWDDLQSTKALVSDLPEKAVLCSYRRYYQSTSFYTQRQVMLVETKGELEFGIRSSTGSPITLTLDTLGRLMETDRNVYCLAAVRYVPSLLANIPDAVIAKKNRGFALLHVPRKQERSFQLIQ